MPHTHTAPPTCIRESGDLEDGVVGGGDVEEEVPAIGHGHELPAARTAGQHLDGEQGEISYLHLLKDSTHKPQLDRVGHYHLHVHVHVCTGGHGHG